MLSESNVREIIEKKEQGVFERTYEGKKESTVETLEAIVDDVIEKFNKLDPGIIENRSKKFPSRDVSYATIEAIEQVQQEVQDKEKPTILEKRVMRTESMALYYLLSMDVLNQMAWKYCDEMGKEYITLDPEEKLDIKTNLAVRFIESVVDKSKEYEIFRSFPRAPSFGLEYEYIDPLELITSRRQRLDTQLSYMSSLAKGEPLTEEQKDKIIEDKTFSDEYLTYYKKTPEEIAAYIDYLEQKKLALDSIAKVDIANFTLPKNKESSDTERNALRLSQLAIFEQWANALESEKKTAASEQLATEVQSWIHILKGELTTLAGKDLESVSMSILVDVVPTQAAIMAKTGAFRHKEEVSPEVREIVTRPSYSVNLQMRELLELLELGNLEDEISPHFTSSGVRLDEQHTNIMEIRAILSGAQYTEQVQKFSDESREIIRMGGNVTHERYIKASGENNQFYFPYHRYRSSVEKPKVIKKYANKHTDGVEFRSWNTMYQTDYWGIVRTATFIDVGSWGESFTQLKETESLTDKEQQVSDAWTELLENWSKLLGEYDIYQPKPHERYIDLLQPNSKEKYVNYINRIELKVQEEKEQQVPYEESFQHKIRLMIINYRSKVKGLLKEPDQEIIESS